MGGRIAAATPTGDKVGGAWRRAVIDLALQPAGCPTCTLGRLRRTRRLAINREIVQIMNSVRLKAEEKFAKGMKQAKKALNEREKAQQEFAAKTARLRALRLAKEASEQEAAIRDAADRAAAKRKTPSKSVRATKRKPVSPEKSAPGPDID
jgi:hypothetical protein